MNKTIFPEIRLSGFDEEWVERKFVDLAERRTQVVDNSPITVEYEDIDSGFGVLNKDLRDKKHTKAGISFEPGDVLYGKLRPYLKNWIRPSFKGAAVGDFWVLRGKETESSFLYYLLQSDAFATISGISSGSKMPRADWGLVSQSLFSCPEAVEEQKRIGSLFSAFDALIDTHRKKLDKLQQTKISLLQKMFPLGDSEEPEMRLAGFDGKWEPTAIGEITSIGNGRDYKHLSPGPIPVYGTGGYMLSVDGALSYSRDAIGIGRKGTIDKPFILKAPFWTVDTLFYVLPDKSTDLHFLRCQFELVDWKTKDESTGVPSLSKDTIANVEILVPSSEEQEKIGLFFSALDNLIVSRRKMLDKLQQVRISLLQKMFVSAEETV